MKLLRIDLRWALLLAWCTVAMTAHANLVYVDYRDINPPSSSFPGAGGPHWTGFVDTLANTLTIQTWTEIPGSVDFWTPLWTPDLTVLPLVWPAFDFHGDEYDVPDAFDGTIDSTFAFISTVSARNMKWNEGSFSLPAVADFYPGWGGVRRPTPGSNPVELFYDTGYDQRTMPLLPRDALGVAASTLATVTISYGASPEGVPEASACLFGVVASAATMLKLRRRRRSRRVHSPSDV